MSRERDDTWACVRDVVLVAVLMIFGLLVLCSGCEGPTQRISDEAQAGRADVHEVSGLLASAGASLDAAVETGEVGASAKPFRGRRETGRGPGPGGDEPVGASDREDSLRHTQDRRPGDLGRGDHAAVDVDRSRSGGHRGPVVPWPLAESWRSVAHGGDPSPLFTEIGRPPSTQGQDEGSGGGVENRPGGRSGVASGSEAEEQRHWREWLAWIVYFGVAVLMVRYAGVRVRRST
jgi:hypothetical protein